MKILKQAFKTRISARREPGDVTQARHEANKVGINLDTRNGWMSPRGVPNCFGPDPNLDNVWLNSPSFMLHAFDEGLVEKFVACVVRWAILDAYELHGMQKSDVTRLIDASFAKTFNERLLNSNVEVNGRDCFQCFPHGVVGFLLDKRRLNAKWYGPLSDQLQFPHGE